MTTPWVEVQKALTEEVVDGVPSYVCACTILSSAGIGREVFVWSVQGDKYNHVATADEMSMYPTSSIAARAEGKSFYRQTTARLREADPNSLQYWIKAMELRLSELCAAWAPPVDMIFPSQSTTTIGGV